MTPRADVEARLDAFAEHGGALALVHHDRRITHGELRDAVYRTARALDVPGIEPGSVVALVAGNEPAGIVARYAVNLLGAGITQPYSGLSATARGRIVDDVDAAALLVVPGHEQEAGDLLEHCAPVERIDLMLQAGRRPSSAEDPDEPAEVLAAIERERITDMWLLPPLLHRLLDHPDLDRTDTSSLRTVIYGGAPAVPARVAEAVRRIGPVFVQFYGQTEAGGISLLPREEHADPELLGTVGRVLPTTELSIRAEDGTAVAGGATGELWVRTGMAMDGYWKDPELTARTIDPDGWVHTGDVGHLDERGYLHVDDRLSDVVVVVGGHVHTHEVENVLVDDGGVREAAVFGTPAADGWETVAAAIVAEPGVEVDADALHDLVVERQGEMYAPTDVEFVDEMPLTDAGKVDKKALRAQLAGDR